MLTQDLELQRQSGALRDEADRAVAVVDRPCRSLRSRRRRENRLSGRRCRKEASEADVIDEVSVCVLHVVLHYSVDRRPLDLSTPGLGVHVRRGAKLLVHDRRPCKAKRGRRRDERAHQDDQTRENVLDLVDVHVTSFQFGL
jgi:hypothetical protein